MQLAMVRVAGLGRLADATMKVRGKVTAVVGPNEAGKSTLLRALASVSNDNPFTEGPGGDIPRRSSPEPSEVALEMEFALDADDQQVLAHIPSEMRPTWLIATKVYGGGVTYKIETHGRRVRAPRQSGADAAEHLGSTLEQVATREDLSEEDRSRVANLLEQARTAQATLTDSADPATLSADALAALGEFRDEIAAAPSELLVDKDAEIVALDAMLESEREAHPTDRMLSTLMPRVPQVAVFGEADRALAYEYNLEGMTSDAVPPALSNLAVSAELDMDGLLADFAAGRWDALAERIADANDELKALFNASWTAGSGTAAVYLDRDGTILRIMVTSPLGRFSPVTERSDGLRMFVALTTFVQAHTDGDHPVVLLIDEAENHLHYDAQADLMGVLARQELASQVVYTTHSAGCLPDELGGNIVAVVPDSKTGRSTINSSYWTAGLGFSPLMMAMGAGAAAFTPSRYAVLAEGHSEALILPRLIREATGLPRLGYQVAAGVAEASGKDIPSLDAEAAHVAYLVDGDGGGDNNAGKLARAGIPGARIIRLGGKGSDLCLEDLIKPDIYAAAADAAREALGHEPTKTEVAARLIDVEAEIVAPDKTELLSALHVELSDALEIPDERRPKLTSK